MIALTGIVFTLAFVMVQFSAIALGRRTFDAGCAADHQGARRLVFPTTDWEDYLTLAFDAIRQYGNGSIQVMRRLRSALIGLEDSVTESDRKETVRGYLEHLDRVVGQSRFVSEQQAC